MSFWRTKNSKKITSDSIAVKTDGTTLKDYLSDNGWILLDSGFGCYYKKVGDVVTITCTSTINKTLSNYGFVGFANRLPEDARPSKKLKIALYSSGSSIISGDVETNGQVGIYCWGTGKTFEAGQLGFTITYLV